MELLRLRAGPLHMVFDPARTFLRHIRLGEREVVRGIYGAVRDRNWDTVPVRVHDLNVQDGGDGFRIDFDAECRAEEVHFTWRGEVLGSADGSVTFLFDGVARTSFLKNRIGLCVLHPAECAGLPCRVQHSDGTETAGAFPRYISPHQPFKNLRAIAHEVEPGLLAEVAFEGEAFEMEDQRNWTDASFKTYSTPLELPFPVRLPAGERVRQSVTLRTSLGARGPDSPRRVGTSLGETQPRVHVDWSAARPLPPIGLGMATTGRPLTAAARDALARLRPAHLRVDLSLASAGWRESWREALELAAQLPTRIHAALLLSDSAERELEAVAAEVAGRRPPLDLWLVFHAREKVTSPRWAELAAGVLGRLDPQVPLAAGTNAYFAELNRQRPPTDSPALPCFSFNPQVHAFDDLSLVETLGAQRSTIASLQQFCPRPAVISPVTLRPRFNPNATQASEDAEPESDPRQGTEFAAAWTLGTLAQLAPCAGVHSLTFYETAGPRGVMDEAGHPFPMFHVFAALAGWPLVSPCTSTHPLLAAALAVCDREGRRGVLVAGFEPVPQQVVLENVAGTIGVRRLGPAGFEAADSVLVADGTACVQVPARSVVLLEWLDSPEPRGAGGSIPAREEHA